MSEQREFFVATYCAPGETRKGRVRTYTLWYSPEWKDYRGYRIMATSGAEAKRIARDRRLRDEKEGTGE